MQSTALKVSHVAFTSYPVTDVQRARKFYEDVLHLTPGNMFNMEAGVYWVEYDINGQTLAISNISEDWQPNRGGGSIALEVDDFDAAMASLKEAQVTFYTEPFDTPGCRIAIISDPDGNAILIHHTHPGRTC